MTVDVVTTPLMIAEEETESLRVASQGAAAIVARISWRWRGTVGMPVAPGVAGKIMTTGSCERPWRGNGWASNREHAAWTDWIARVTAQKGEGVHVGRRHFHCARLLDFLTAGMITHHIIRPHTGRFHLRINKTNLRWCPMPNITTNKSSLNHITLHQYQVQS
ncbi:hypothetical protein GOODEAATRI_027307 [Goodea atripinnis]|uniref:Uncharacterized protein n=1 Tax=Goodea atripinnis TaxID=208336 RepID=A0ABV0MVT3_9TELE